MITTVVLVNPSIMSYNYHFFPVMRKIKIWSLSNFEVYKHSFVLFCLLHWVFIAVHGLFVAVPEIL